MAYLLSQAFELYPPCCCYSSSYNERIDCIYHVLGSLSLWCIFRPSPSVTSMDLDHNRELLQLYVSECQFADHITLVDFDFLIPCYSESCYDQTWNCSLSSCRVSSKFREHVFSSSAVTFDTREWAGGTALRLDTKDMGFRRRCGSTHAGCEWSYWGAVV